MFRGSKVHNSAEEVDIIHQVLGFCNSGGTHQQPDVMQIPVSDYRDPTHFQHEVDVLFRQFPIIVGHSSQLPEPGRFFTHDGTGMPLLITRTRDGDVKAFLNVCRHRGARIENRTCGKANTFACPYHAWTYDLTGALRGYPHAAGFGEIDKAEFGLIEVPAHERFGLLWVRPTPSDTPIDIDAWLAPMAEQMASLDLHKHVVFREWRLQRDMNWHIALEGFQEQYHFCTAHKHTACGAYLDNQGVFVDQYPHVRHAVPLSNFEKLRGLEPEQWNYRKSFMTQNYLFPCNFLQVMTDHVYVHSILPVSVDRCVFQCVMLIPETPSSDKAEKHWAANYQVVRDVFEEDFLIGESIQAGLHSMANSHFTIGRYESGLQMARKAIEDALAGRLRA